MIADTCISICDDLNQPPSWPWPEPRVRYDAGRIPQAMLECGALLSRPEFIHSGLQRLAWLDGIMTAGGTLRVVGHLGLGPADRIDDSGDEQPVEVAALAGCSRRRACRVSDNAVHRSRIDQCLGWFHGRNRLGVAMVDPQTGATHDGLGATTPNDNEGAESTMAYLMTALTRATIGAQRTEGSGRHCSHDSAMSRFSAPQDLPGSNSVFNPGACIVGDQTVLAVRVEDRRGMSAIHIARSDDGITHWSLDESPLLAPTPTMRHVSGASRILDSHIWTNSTGT